MKLTEQQLRIIVRECLLEQLGDTSSDAYIKQHGVYKKRLAGMPGIIESELGAYRDMLHNMLVDIEEKLPDKYDLVSRATIAQEIGRQIVGFIE